MPFGRYFSVKIIRRTNKTMDKKLDNIFFRVNHEGKMQEIYWSELTETEMDEILKDKDLEFCKILCKTLGQTIHELADESDYFREICIKKLSEF